MAVYDGKKIKKFREEKGWKLPDLADETERLAASNPREYVPVSEKTIWRVESNIGNHRSITMHTIAKALGVGVADFVARSTGEPTASSLPAGVLDAVCQTGRIAITDSLYAGRGVLKWPHIAGDAETNEGKITSKDLASDPMYPIDKVTSIGIQEEMERAYNDPSHPLSEGFHLIDEEYGYIPRFSKGGTAKWLVFVDSTDDTAKARRGLGGTSLISFYHPLVGWCCTVIGDFQRMRLFYRTAGEQSVALQLHYDPRPESMHRQEVPFRDPQGWPLRLKSSRQTSLKSAAINIYMGKPGRVIGAAEGAREVLLKATDGEMFSYGGSSGPLLVAEELLDLAIEVEKGFRPLDLIPGCFIAAGVEGVVVQDLQGKAMSFGPDAHFEEVFDRLIDKGFDKKLFNTLFDSLRRKFLVAASEELAAAVVAALRSTP